MENIVSLPSWANILFVVAVALLCVMKVANWLKKVKGDLPAMKASKITFSTYCVVSVVVIIGLAAYFFLTKSMSFDWSCMGISCAILFLAMVVTFPLAEDRNAIEALAITAPIAVILIVFVIMLYGDMGFAALWLLITMTLAIGGWLLKRKTN